MRSAAPSVILLANASMRKELPVLVATLIAGVLAIPATYAVLRAYAVLLGAPEPNPATVVWSAHIAMFWRLNIGVFVAGMVGFCAYPAARANLPRTLRVVNACVVVVAVMIALQGLLLP